MEYYSRASHIEADEEEVQVLESVRLLIQEWKHLRQEVTQYAELLAGDNYFPFRVFAYLRPLLQVERGYALIQSGKPCTGVLAMGE
jgi:hypothetical protein